MVCHLCRTVNSDKGIMLSNKYSEYVVSCTQVGRLDLWADSYFWEHIFIHMCACMHVQNYVGTHEKCILTSLFQEFHVDIIALIMFKS